MPQDSPIYALHLVLEKTLFLYAHGRLPISLCACLTKITIKTALLLRVLLSSQFVYSGKSPATRDRLRRHPPIELRPMTTSYNSRRSFHQLHSFYPLQNIYLIYTSTTPQRKYCKWPPTLDTSALPSATPSRRISSSRGRTRSLRRLIRLRRICLVSRGLKGITYRMILKCVALIYRWVYDERG